MRQRAALGGQQCAALGGRQNAAQGARRSSAAAPKMFAVPQCVPEQRSVERVPPYVAPGPKNAALAPRRVVPAQRSAVQARPDEPSREGRRLVAVVPQKPPLLRGTGENKAQAPLRGSPVAAT